MDWPCQDFTQGSTREQLNADAINDLQYCRGKMATMSEMSLKKELNVGLVRNSSTNTEHQEKLHHK